MAMVAMAAAAFHAGHPEVAEIETAYHTLTPLLGAGAAGLFLVSLLASGVSRSVVGTMAGQVIMQGFIRRTIPSGCAGSSRSSPPSSWSGSASIPRGRW